MPHFDGRRDGRTAMVYRVEDRLGRGPYYGRSMSDSQTRWTDDGEHTAGNGHPSFDFDETFTADDRREINDPSGVPYVRFGFVTLDQLHHWFSESELRRLRVLGYRIVERQAIRIWVSDYQCAYEPGD